MPKQFIRNDGSVLVAEDFQTTSGVKLSETAATEGNIADGAVTAPKLATGAVATNLGFTPEDNSNKKTSLSDNSDTYYPSQKAVKTAVDAKQDALGFTPEDTANKSTDGTLASNSDTLFPSEKAVKTYVDAHGGGGPAQSPVNGNHKDLSTTLGVNDLFSVPLADGEGVAIQLNFSAIAKKAPSDWAVFGGFWPLVYYNEGNVLKDGTGLARSGDVEHAAGAMNLASCNGIVASLADGILTVQFDTTGLGTTPDSIAMDFTILNPLAKVVTLI